MPPAAGRFATGDVKGGTQSSGGHLDRDARRSRRPPAAGRRGPQPYGTNDAGGFRNVLPPGRDGLDNARELARFQAAGTLPPHFTDQQPLYDDLLYASPTLTHDQIPQLLQGRDVRRASRATSTRRSTRARASRSCATRATASRTSTATRAPT